MYEDTRWRYWGEIKFTQTLHSVIPSEKFIYIHNICPERHSFWDARHSDGGNLNLSCVICHSSALLDNGQQGSIVIEWSWTIHNKYCHMLTTFDICNNLVSRIGTSPTEGPGTALKQPFASMSLLWHFLCRCYFMNRSDNHTADGLSVRNILWTKAYFFVSVCSTCTVVASSPWHNLHIIQGHRFMSASALVFGLKLSGTLLWASVCYLSVWHLNNVSVFWKLLYQSYLKMCF